MLATGRRRRTAAIRVGAGRRPTTWRLIAAARERVRARTSDEEYRRLLYVGDDARHRPAGGVRRRGRAQTAGGLLVRTWCPTPCGRCRSRKPADDGDGIVWRYRKTTVRRRHARHRRQRPQHRQEHAAWLDRRRCRPSRRRGCRSRRRARSMTSDAGACGRAGRPAEREKAMARGTLVHRLLQSLPDIPRAARTEAALAATSRAQPAISRAEERARSCSRRCTRVLDDPRFAELFAPGQPRRGADRRAARPNGRTVRRLRPGRPPGRHRRCGADRRLQDQPSGPASDSRTCRRPMSASSRSIAPCWPSSIPDKTIRAALLWTDVPDLMEIPAAAMDRDWPPSPRREAALTLGRPRS